MSVLDHRAAPVSPRRRAGLVRALDEAGDTMIEVVIAALLVALIAAAVFTSLSAAAHISGAQRHEGVAIGLAQQDEQRLRGLTVQELVASAGTSCTGTAPLDGNGCYTPPPIDNETYTITSTAHFYSASSGALSCSTNGVGSADYIATTSTVTWQNNNDGRQPVEEHSLITPSSGGQIVVAVQDDVGASPTGLSGVTVTITGPGTSTTSQSQTTDNNGCALFVAIAAGSYNVSATIPSPYVTYGGTTQQSVQVANNQTQTVTFDVARGATVNAGFSTTVNGTTSSIPFDTFALEATSESPAQSFGTVGTYAAPPSTVTSGATIYPYSSGYDAYAGTCTNDDPGASKDTPVSVSEGGTAAATVKVPSMLLAMSTQGGGQIVNDDSSQVTYSGTWGYSIGQSWNNSPPYPGDYDDDEHASDTGGSTASFTFTGTSVEWITSMDSTKGYADVYIDNTDVAPNIDLYSPWRVNQVIGYAATGLSNGTHTIKIKVDGTHDSHSSDYYVSVDAFVVGSVTQVDDNSSSVTYTGSNWVHYSDGGDYDGDEHYDTTQGDSASYTFTGTGIEWISNLYSNHGYANVAIDGTTVATNIDTYGGSGKTYAYPAFSDVNLAYGTHTIKITVDGTHDSNATGTYVTVDEFVVTSDQAGSSSVTTWPSGWTIETYDSCSTPVGRTLPSNPTATTVSSQTVFPVPAPYGSSVRACIANGTTNSNTGELPSGSTLSNTDFNGTTIQSLTLPTTSGSGSTAVFANSGSCP